MVQPVSREVSSQLFAPRCRVQGGFAIFACEILATLGFSMPRAKRSGQLCLRHPRNSELRYALT